MSPPSVPPPTVPSTLEARRICAGAVLVGGASSRMGVDKASLLVGGTAMAARVAAALRNAGIHDVVAIGGTATGAAHHGLPVVPDRWPGEGPLGGVATALGWYTAARPEVDAVLVVACDLPWLDAASVSALHEGWRTAAADVTVVVGHGNRREPLCAVWSLAATTRLEQRFTSGERAVHRALAAETVREVPLDPAALRNVNRPSDLTGVPHGGDEGADKVPRHADS